MVLAELLAELLRNGQVDFVARISVDDFRELPRAVVVPIPPTSAVMPDGQVEGRSFTSIDYLLSIVQYRLYLLLRFIQIRYVRWTICVSNLLVTAATYSCL